MNGQSRAGQFCRVVFVRSSALKIVTAAPRCLDYENVAWRQFAPVGAGHHMTAAISMLDPLTAERSLGTAGEAERSDVAAG